MDASGTFRIWIWKDKASIFSEKETLLSPPSAMPYLENLPPIHTNLLLITSNDHYLLAGAGGEKVTLFQRQIKNSELNYAPKINIEGPDAAEELKQFSTLNPGFPSTISCLEFHPTNNNYIVLGFSSRNAGIYKFGKMTIKVTLLTEHGACVADATFSADAKYLATYSMNGSLYFWANDNSYISNPGKKDDAEGRAAASETPSMGGSPIKLAPTKRVKGNIKKKTLLSFIPLVP